MELLATRDPEDAREILDPVLERLMDAVEHHAGTVSESTCPCGLRCRSWAEAWGAGMTGRP